MAKEAWREVQRDEPLFEISTDKVDAEIPAPASGVLKEIKIQPGATVQVNTVVGVIDADGAGASSAGTPVQQSAAAQTPASPPQPAKDASSPSPSSATSTPPAPHRPAQPSAGTAGNGGGGSAAIDVVMPQMGESISEGTLRSGPEEPRRQSPTDEPPFKNINRQSGWRFQLQPAVFARNQRKEGATVQVKCRRVVTIGGAGTPASAAPAQPSAAPPTTPPAAQVPHAAQPASSPLLPSSGSR